MRERIAMLGYVGNPRCNKPSNDRKPSGRNRARTFARKNAIHREHKPDQQGNREQAIGGQSQRAEIDYAVHEQGKSRTNLKWRLRPKWSGLVVNDCPTAQLQIRKRRERLGIYPHVWREIVGVQLRTVHCLTANRYRYAGVL